MEATGQGQEAHRLVGAVGFGKDFRDHLVPPNAGISSLPEYLSIQNPFPSLSPRELNLCQRTLP